MNPPDLDIAHIRVGDSASFERTFVEQDVVDFARLSGDMNPLHMDEAYASGTKFGQRLVHGMLVASLCSAFVGMHIPGRRCLYLGQSLSFRKPVFIGDSLVVTGAVESVSHSTGIVTIALSVEKKGAERCVVMTGSATVQVL